MRIGILTFHDANNYGAVLQAYALKKKLSEFGEASIINYYNPFFHKRLNYGIKEKIIELIYSDENKKRINAFKNFRNKYLKTNNEVITKDNIISLNDKYDCFITGSDQVWNLNCSGNDDTYFLDFVKDSKKRNSYSASFGTSDIHLNYKHLNMIKSFNKISVREKSGCTYLRDNNINSYETCDPVFLLKKEEWVSITKEINEKYILIYEVVNGNKILEFAKKIAKLKGYKIKMITSSNKPIFGVETIRNAGPIEWLNLLKNAQYVITNSFHGLAFSLIFNKQFNIELLSNSNSNARIIDLLKDLSLENRIIDKYNWNEIIDYKEVDKVINEKISRSLKYINSIMGVEYEK